VNVYVERGSKRTFASAVDWPGWSRSGRDESSALEVLLVYGPRYARVVGRSRLGFAAPASVDDLTVSNRVRGTAGTDFGVPEVAASSDAEPVDDAELRRLVTILRACWRALDRAAAAISGPVHGSTRGRSLGCGMTAPLPLRRRCRRTWPVL